MPAPTAAPIPAPTPGRLAMPLPGPEGSCDGRLPAPGPEGSCDGRLPAKLAPPAGSCADQFGVTLPVVVARPGIKAVAETVDAEEVHGWVGEEDVLGAVAVMDVKVHDQDPRGPGVDHD